MLPLLDQLIGIEAGEGIDYCARYAPAVGIGVEVTNGQDIGIHERASVFGGHAMRQLDAIIGLVMLIALAGIAALVPLPKIRLVRTSHTE